MNAFFYSASPAFLGHTPLSGKDGEGVEVNMQTAEMLLNGRAAAGQFTGQESLAQLQKDVSVVKTSILEMQQVRKKLKEALDAANAKTREASERLRMEEGKVQALAAQVDLLKRQHEQVRKVRGGQVNEENQRETRRLAIEEALKAHRRNYTAELEQLNADIKNAEQMLLDDFKRREDPATAAAATVTATAPPATTAVDVAPAATGASAATAFSTVASSPE